MTAIQRFWDAKWEAYRLARPDATERPSWLKPSITPEAAQNARKAAPSATCGQTPAGLGGAACNLPARHAFGFCAHVVRHSD